MTLTEFLLLRIEADQNTALAAGHGCGYIHEHNAGWVEIDLPAEHNVRPSYEMRFISRFDPDRVLAECAAKRVIVEAPRSECSAYGDPINAEVAAHIGMPEAKHYPDPDYAGHCDGCSAAESADADRAWVIKVLAAVYADHPDYDETWRP